ncbi:hypothetical protein SKAU_G00188070 [Synaphobranchus kaupii]|uniref:Uncharacterized protein n=1 Tax=Synaphobranchus kaupii TaxID=118154 RepID=A0A9Q1FCV8_SYNKA|nr:hypothetical protein SKAU_G00188070 [Synaphobranchus kaupii]
MTAISGQRGSALTALERRPAAFRESRGLAAPESLRGSAVISNPSRVRGRRASDRKPPELRPAAESPDEGGPRPVKRVTLRAVRRVVYRVVRRRFQAPA